MMDHSETETWNPVLQAKELTVVPSAAGEVDLVGAARVVGMEGRLSARRAEILENCILFEDLRFGVAELSLNTSRESKRLYTQFLNFIKSTPPISTPAFITQSTTSPSFQAMFILSLQSSVLCVSKNTKNTIISLPDESAVRIPSTRLYQSISDHRNDFSAVLLSRYSRHK